MVKRKSKSPEKLVLKVQILLPVAGKFYLSHNVGDVVEMEAKQALEIVDAEYAKIVE